MSSVPLRRLMDAVDATWPPAEIVNQGGWVLRRGAGGGKRVSAASLADPRATLPTLAKAEEVMASWGQDRLFRLTPENGAQEAELDSLLADAGFRVIDPVAIYVQPVAELLDRSDETARIIRIDTPLGLVREIWAAGGIGAARLAIMTRARGPKRILLARLGDHPSGVAFVACDQDIAMIHAIEVLKDRRKQGVGEMLMRGAASFAAEQGAETIGLAVTEANTPARRLYEKLGMEVAGRYHYRLRDRAT